MTATLRERLDQLEQDLARDDDRSVDEYRQRHPDNVAAIDTLRAVLATADRLETKALNWARGARFDSVSRWGQGIAHANREAAHEIRNAIAAALDEARR